jgi:hypothetical protein
MGAPCVRVSVVEPCLSQHRVIQNAMKTELLCSINAVYMSSPERSAMMERGAIHNVVEREKPP